MLTTFDLDEYVFEALHAGASGFLLKDVEPDELRHAVRVVAAGDALLSPSVTRRLISGDAGLRERSRAGPLRSSAHPGAVAEWLRSGLQSRVHRFDSGRRL